MLYRSVLVMLLVVSAVRVEADDDDFDKPDLDDRDDKDKPDLDDLDDDDFDRLGPVTPRRNNWYCVPYYQCKDGNIITDGAGLIDPRRNPTKDIPLNGKMSSSSCVSPYVLCRVSNGSLNEQPYRHKCGIRRPNGVDARILSSNQDGETEFGEFPWQGAILQEVDGQKVFKCACVLIDERWALTVAHCAAPLRSSRNRLFALFGVRNTRADREPLPAQSVQILNFTIHRDFDSKNLRNDIALVRFKERVSYSPSVDTICLPYMREGHTGQRCVVTGWGKNAWDGGNYSPVLRKVSVPVLNSSQCQMKLRRTRLGDFYELHKSAICAGGNRGQDACKGDGGGPLACYRSDGTYALMGLVSWGIDCGQPNVPGVYTNVPEFLRWIAQVTRHNLQHFWPPNVGPQS